MFCKSLPGIPEDMPQYDAGCDDFGDDDDLGDAEAIQALSNAEKSHEEKPDIKVLP